MKGQNSKLLELESSGKKINLALIGAGQMGLGLVSQVFCMKGIGVAKHIVS